MKKIFLFGIIFLILFLSYQAFTYTIHNHIGDKTGIAPTVHEPANIFLLGVGMLVAGILLRKKVQMKSKDK